MIRNRAFRFLLIDLEWKLLHNDERGWEIPLGTSVGSGFVVFSMPLCTGLKILAFPSTSLAGLEFPISSTAALVGQGFDLYFWLDLRFSCVLAYEILNASSRYAQDWIYLWSNAYHTCHGCHEWIEKSALRYLASNAELRYLVHLLFRSDAEVSWASNTFGSSSGTAKPGKPWFRKKQMGKKRLLNALWLWERRPKFKCESHRGLCARIILHVPRREVWAW